MEDATGRSEVRRSSLRPSVRGRDAWFLGLSLLVVVLDQFTKWLIRETIALGGAWPNESWPVRLVHYQNSGAAFGILQNAGPLLVVTSLIGMAAILVYLFNPGFAHPLMRAGLAMMFGGAIGNLIDRVLNGSVVDFIQVPHWPAFNVADSGISIGVVLLLWAMLRDQSKTAPGNS